MIRVIAEVVLGEEGEEEGEVAEEEGSGLRWPAGGLGFGRLQHGTLFVKNFEVLWLNDLLLVVDFAEVAAAERTVALSLHKPRLTLPHFDKHR